MQEHETHSNESGVNETAAAALGADAPPAPRASGDGRIGRKQCGEVEPGTPLSNTVPSKYIEQENPDNRILRCAVDSLYLSYKGELSIEMDDRLGERKESAQSDNDNEQSTAQITIADHLFQVAGHGTPHFRYIINDDRFRIQISRGKKMPLAYVQISSELLTFKSIPVIEEELRLVVNSLGLVDGEASISRVDPCVDFIPAYSLENFNARQWLTRARKKAAYWSGDDFTGWAIGAGGAIKSRTYDKVLEIIEESNKTYLFKVWELLGWQPGQPVWRQEFEVKGAALKELKIATIPQLLDNLGGLWRYLTEDWLRLTEMGSDSNKSRWKTHPLWTDIQAAIWTKTPQLALERIRSSALPKDDRIFPSAIGYVSSLMAREGITDFDEGLGTFLHQAELYYKLQGGSLARHVEAKTRHKGRKFNTINNRTSRDAQEAQDGAESYLKARDGEDG